MFALGRERLLIWTVGLLMVAVSLGIGFVGTPFTATQEEIEATAASPGVDVSRMGQGYVLSPSVVAGNQDQKAKGLVFYPGARVHPDAYVPVLAPVVERTGVTIFIPKPPLNLAVFDQNMADPIIDDHGDIDQWFVGGHSLGGAMACRYAQQEPDRLEGLVLFGSYCDRSLKEDHLRVLAVIGGADTVLDQSTYRQNRDNLPDDTTTELNIDGMNHTQFGVYSGQPGDSPATISYEQAHEALQDTLSAYVTADTKNSST